MAQVYLVCEGERASLDLRLLDAVLAQWYGLSIVIEPGGGGRNPRIVRQWLEQRVTGDVAFLIHDRDYEPLAPIQQDWLDPGEKRLCWTVHEIENHLLEPWVIHELFEHYRRTLAAEAWVTRLPKDAAAIEGVMQALAPRLFNDHVGRLLCGQLRRHKLTLGPTELNVPAIDPLAGSATQWQAGIQAQVAQLHTTCGAITGAPEFQPAAIAAGWTAIEQAVHQPAFLSSGAYRRELKGKRLLNLFWGESRASYGYPGTEEEMTDDLVTTVRRTYRTVAQYTFDDFDKLADRLRNA